MATKEQIVQKKFGLDYLLEQKKCPPHEFEEKMYFLVDITIEPKRLVRVCKVCQGVFADPEYEEF